jgi:hypothetical protein
MRSQPSTTPSQATHKRPERGTDAALARRRAVIASVDTDSATAVGGVTNRDVFPPNCEDSRATASSAGADEPVDGRSAMTPATTRIGPRRSRCASC